MSTQKELSDLEQLVSSAKEFFPNDFQDAAKELEAYKEALRDLLGDYDLIPLQEHSPRELECKWCGRVFFEEDEDCPQDDLCPSDDCAGHNARALI